MRSEPFLAAIEEQEEEAIHFAKTINYPSALSRAANVYKLQSMLLPR